MYIYITKREVYQFEFKINYCVTSEFSLHNKSIRVTIHAIFPGQVLSRICFPVFMLAEGNDRKVV